MPDNKEFNQTQNPALDDNEAAACAAANAAEEADAEDRGAEGGESAEYEVLVKLKDENEALKDKVLREAAEMENLRRRTAKEVADAKIYAVTGFARDMLAVADNLSRALGAIPVDARENDPQLKTLAEGVEMTERAMQAALERHGVHKMETIGRKFDPNIHDAIGAMEDKSVPHNTIKHEAEAGYMIHGRVLRPAKVMTAQGGEKETSSL